MSEITIKTTTEFLDSAYEAACGPWKEKLKSNIDYYKNKKVYKRGDRFGYDGNEYILVHFTRAGAGYAMLTNLKDGNRWTDPVEVRDYSKITEEEFKELVSGYDGFKKLN